MTLNPAAPSTQVSFPSGCKVYDIADPDAFGTVFTAGPEVSEVKFTDGNYRNIPNVHLRIVAAPIVADELSWLNPSPAVSQIVRLGQEAMARIPSSRTCMMNLSVK